MWIYIREIIMWQSGERIKCIIRCKYKFTRFLNLFSVSLWRKANARNVRPYYPYRQYTDLFIFRFVSLLCLPLRRTLRLYYKSCRLIGWTFEIISTSYLQLFHYFSITGLYTLRKRRRKLCDREVLINETYKLHSLLPP